MDKNNKNNNDTNNIDKLIKQYKLFWQYPVITEKAFHDQNITNDNYLGVPWATILDKNYNLQLIFKIFAPHLDKTKSYYTCCQHIHFRKLHHLFNALNISTVYTPHKKLGENALQTVGKLDILLKACPLYAVNIEDRARNSVYQRCRGDLYGKSRKWLYSFVGGYQPTNYLTDVRGRIFAGVHDSGASGGDVYIKNTGAWFFNNVVYSRKQNAVGELNEGADKAGEVNEYMSVMADSRWALCPGGSGPSSIRFWEALALGAIPVLLSDTMDLPEHKLWGDAIVRVPEVDVGGVREVLESISWEREQEMRENCVKIYEELRGNYRGSITQVVHYCCDTFETGAVGGVARYDYQIKLAFPNRRFFKGPQHKVQMLAFLEQCGEVVVITDNHLACDIPNKYRCLLVHHGCAMTTSTRNPDWGEPWRSLCTNGQNRMLDMRDPSMTDIISISRACTDDFINFYGEKYTKFNRIPLLHPSELDENRYKQTWNRSPVVLGNWYGLKKGERLLPILKNKITNFNFQQLDVRIDNRGIENFNKRKQKIYLDADIFLQISNSEGNSYATLDALICGLVVVASNVGLFYADIPEDCFVKIDWERNGDAKYVEEKLRYAWDNRVELGENAREWYMKNCRLSGWIEKMREIV
jgi:hypothetical protein